MTAPSQSGCWALLHIMPSCHTHATMCCYEASTHKIACRGSAATTLGHVAMHVWPSPMKHHTGAQTAGRTTDRRGGHETAANGSCLPVTYGGGRRCCDWGPMTCLKRAADCFKAPMRSCMLPAPAALPLLCCMTPKTSSSTSSDLHGTALIQPLM